MEKPETVVRQLRLGCTLLAAGACLRLSLLLGATSFFTAILTASSLLEWAMSDYRDMGWFEKPFRDN